MIRPAIQLVSACTGVLLLAGASAFVLARGADVFVATAIVAGLALLVPAFVERGQREDLHHLTRELERYRMAMFGCFGAALAIYAVIVSLQMSSSATQNRVAALGAAFWLVGFVLMFFVVYYGSRRAIAQARDDDGCE
jgi:hypothetical protein